MILLLLPLLVGCIGHGHLAGGAVGPIPPAGSSGAGVIEFRAGATPLTRQAIRNEPVSTLFTMGFAAKAKFSPEFAQIALAPEACAAFDQTSVLPMLCGGVHAFQLEFIHGRVAVGTAAYVTPTLAIPLGVQIMPAAFFVSVPIEYTIRFGEEPSRLYAGLTVGYGLAVRSESWRREMKRRER